VKVAGFDLHDDLGPQRDAQIVEIVLGGGAVLWPWVQVPLEDGRGYFEVASDYLAIGTSSDWCRVPIGGPAAQIIADRTDSVLPTAFMVDLIWKHGATKLAPKPFQDLKGMTTTRRFVEHQGIIERQREGRAGLVVGCKKDLIISNRLLQFPTSVCIYGWHTADGKPIQPVSTFHKQYWYCDYSHGIRFVKKQMVLDGQTVEVERVWNDPRVANVLTGGERFAAATKQADAVLRVSRYDTTLLSKSSAPTQMPPQDSSSTPAAPQLVRPQTIGPQTVGPQNDLGLRALRWCEQELAAGVGEEPPGSNAGSRIAQYFAPARRRATGQKLGIDRGDWCAVAQSAALAAVARPDEPLPHGYRAAVWELEEDARESQAWVPAADIRSGRYVLQPGDLVIWSRGQPGSRLGHVSRVQIPPDQNGDMMTVGGNETEGTERDKWLNRRRSIKEETFRGAIKYRDYRAVDFDGKKAPAPAVAPAVHPTPAAVAKNDVVVPEKVLTEEGWLRFEEEYLPRVVTGENGRAHPEALKAQAIASRTYVLRAMRDDAKLGRTTPLVNSQKFQVFAKKASPQCVDAVNATRGMVAKHGGRLIIANYVAGAIWSNGVPGADPTKTEKWVTYNDGKRGALVSPTKLSSVKRADNRGCMSQNGADWLARNGKTFEAILRFFYGADLEISSNGNEVQTATINEWKGRTTMATNQVRTPHVVYIKPKAPRPRPSGIDALAMSVGGNWLERNAAPTVGREQQPPTVAVGADQVQEMLEYLNNVAEAINTKMQQIAENDDLRVKWNAYITAFRGFYQINYVNTPQREADSMQRAIQYDSGLKTWNNLVDQRIYTSKINVHEGKIDNGKFPYLPLIGLAAVTIAAAAFVGAAHSK
jgi:Stage II sporulation protein